MHDFSVQCSKADLLLRKDCVSHSHGDVETFKGLLKRTRALR